jgi:hypothetical protein
MAAKVNRRFANRDPLDSFLYANCICQLHTAVTAADSDMVAVRPNNGARAAEQSATGKLPHVEAVMVFAHFVGRYSGHINRSQFSVYLGMCR